MKSKLNCKTSRNWGVASIITSLLSPIVGILFAIIGLNTTREKNKEDRDFTLNSIGIGIAIINYLLTLLLFF